MRERREEQEERMAFYFLIFHFLCPFSLLASLLVQCRDGGGRFEVEATQVLGRKNLGKRVLHKRSLWC
jgi:hypothetical protein